MMRALATCLLLAACGAPAARPVPLAARAVIAAPPEAATPATRPAAPAVERPSWLEPPRRGRTVVTSTTITILDQIGSSASRR